MVFTFGPSKGGEGGRRGRGKGEEEREGAGRRREG